LKPPGLPINPITLTFPESRGVFLGNSLNEGQSKLSHPPLCLINEDGPQPPPPVSLTDKEVVYRCGILKRPVKKGAPFQVAVLWQQFPPVFRFKAAINMDRNVPCYPIPVDTLQCLYQEIVG